MTPVIPISRSKQLQGERLESTTNYGKQNMHDWVEGWLEMSKMISQIHSLILKNEIEKAQELLLEISAVAKLTRHRLTIQNERKTTKLS